MEVQIAVKNWQSRFHFIKRYLYIPVQIMFNISIYYAAYLCASIVTKIH